MSMIFPGSRKENAYFGHTHTRTCTHTCVCNLFKKGLHNTVVKTKQWLTSKHLSQRQRLRKESTVTSFLILFLVFFHDCFSKSHRSDAICPSSSLSQWNFVLIWCCNIFFNNTLKIKHRLPLVPCDAFF